MIQRGESGAESNPQNFDQRLKCRFENTYTVLLSRQQSGTLYVVGRGAVRDGAAERPRGCAALRSIVFADKGRSFD